MVFLMFPSNPQHRHLQKGVFFWFNIFLKHGVTILGFSSTEVTESQENTFAVNFPGVNVC